MELLILLVERQGQLVTRDEIIARLWGKDVFLDAEQGINTAIRKVRRALGDDPEQPRYVATVVGKGYRFIGSTETVGCGAAVQKTSPQLRAEEAVKDLPAHRRSTLSALRLLGLAGASLAVIFGFAAWRSRQQLQGHTAQGYTQHTLTANPALEEIRAIAVLPLENLSGDPSQDYFADGMTDELITHLAQIKSLRVISRTSVLRYQATRESLPKIAQDLKVGAILEGSVLRTEDHVRVNVQLIEAKNDRHIWSESYDRELRDIVILQRQIAIDVFNHVNQVLSSAEKGRFANAAPIDPEAHDAYLKGIYSLRKPVAGGAERAITLFHQAVQRAPDYAPAYVGLARAYVAVGPPRKGIPNAKAAVGKALELDDSLASAHAALAFIEWRYDWNWNEAEKEFRRAIELSPGSAETHSRYAAFLGTMERFDESISEHRLAEELAPLSAEITSELAWTEFYAHRFTQAEGDFRRALAIDPTYGPAQEGLAHVYEHEGRYDEAITEWQKSIVSFGLPTMASRVAQDYRKGGIQRAARGVYEQVKSGKDVPYLPNYVLASLCTTMREKDESLRWLERAYSERELDLAYVGVDPQFDLLRGDSRFQSLVRRIGFR